jgi:transposase-like protein
MRQKSGPEKAPAEQVVKDIRRATRRQFSAEEKIRIVLEGVRGEESIAELCRREGIAASMYYGWSKELLDAGKRRLAGDTARAAELSKLEKQVAQIIEAIADGMYHPSMKEKMTGLEARKAELTALLADAPDILPNAATIYAKKVASLAEALNQPDERPEAAEALRMLIEKIVLTPGPERAEVFATLRGELGTILDWT